ncbi:phage protein Gp27 family protein [Celeribacter sp.]|uniref:phage protein Gp27 family protein n=1 Tax=Celeribacter sp. TaxID=1890673 RepID=UPI003A95A0E5
MPPPRKIDLLPEEDRRWLQDTLRERGFSGYVEITEELNARLLARGSDETLHPATVNRFGQGYEDFVKAQEQAAEWAVNWMQDAGLEDEAQRHNVLFQMVTTLAFKVMQAQMSKDGDEIDPKELHFIGKMLKDVMQSSGVREKLVADERERVAKEAREQALKEVEENLAEAVKAGKVDAQAAEDARRIMGFA